MAALALTIGAAAVAVLLGLAAGAFPTVGTLARGYWGSVCWPRCSFAVRFARVHLRPSRS